METKYGQIIATLANAIETELLTAAQEERLPFGVMPTYDENNNEKVVHFRILGKEEEIDDLNEKITIDQVISVSELVINGKKYYQVGLELLANGYLMGQFRHVMSQDIFDAAYEAYKERYNWKTTVVNYHHTMNNETRVKKRNKRKLGS